MQAKTFLLGGLALAAALGAGSARADWDDWGARVVVPAPSYSVNYWDRGSGISFGINGGPVYYGAPVYYGPPGHWRHDYRDRWHGRGDDHRGWGHRGRWGDDD